MFLLSMQFYSCIYSPLLLYALKLDMIIGMMQISMVNKLKKETCGLRSALHVGSNLGLWGSLDNICRICEYLVRYVIYSSCSWNEEEYILLLYCYQKENPARVSMTMKGAYECVTWYSSLVALSVTGFDTKCVRRFYIWSIIWWQ